MARTDPADRLAPVPRPPSEDPTSGPTAIIPARPGTLNERFDVLARRFGDPLATLFLIQGWSQDEENRIRAASELLPYRYPKLRATELSLAPGSGAPITFNINIGAPAPASAAPPTVDVTPPDPLE